MQVGLFLFCLFETLSLGAGRECDPRCLGQRDKVEEEKAAEDSVHPYPAEGAAPESGEGADAHSGGVR